MPPQNRIMMVKRESPIQDNLPNERTFIARYRRAVHDKLPFNIRLRRPYRQSKCHWPLAAVHQRDQCLSIILKDAKRVITNPLLEILGRTMLNELPTLHRHGTRKIKNKKLKRILQSDIANSLVDMGAEYGREKLE